MFKIFIVDGNTWPEHKKASIAAINDPVVTHPSSNQRFAQRQGAVNEMMGIRPGDKFLFYERGTQKIYGVYEATTQSYFDPLLLFTGARHVNNRLPFRVGFKQIMIFNKQISMNDLWELKEQGVIWSIQQSRGDAVNRRGAWCISTPEYEAIVKIFKEINLSYSTTHTTPPTIARTRQQALPTNNAQTRSSICNASVFLYETALTSILIDGMKNNTFPNIFGQVDDILVKAPTGSKRELDILLLRYGENNDIIWFQIIEAKRQQFALEDALQLQDYYEWYSNHIKDANYRNVHPVALAYSFTQEVIDYVTNLKTYNMNYPRLIQYRYQNNNLSLKDVTP